MFPCGPGSPSIPVPWAAALLLALGVERALAIPEVQKQVRGRIEAELLASRVSRSLALGSLLRGPQLCVPEASPAVAQAAPAPDYSRCAVFPAPSHCLRPKAFEL